MAHLSTGSIETSTEVEPAGAWHLLEIPLEIRGEVYRMLLTTQYCTQVASSETSLEFQFSTNVLLTNKQISKEATRVLLKENDFIKLKVHGSCAILEDIPIFKFHSAEKVTNPVLVFEVKVGHGSHHYDDTAATTLVTTPEGLQPIISALWKLDRYTPGIINASYTSDLSISLNFNVKASIQRNALKNLVLKPWELLHGIKHLTLLGDIGDSMSLHLRKSMLEAPCLTDIAIVLTKYHSMRLNEMAKKNYSVARWWWTLYADYWRHLGLLRFDPSIVHPANDAISSLWAELWTQFGKMYSQTRLGTVITYLHQSMWKDAVSTAIKARSEKFRLFYAPSGLLKEKLLVCEALAHLASGDRGNGLACHMRASIVRLSFLFGRGPKPTPRSEMLSKKLWILLNWELIKLDSPYRFKTGRIPASEDESPVDCQAGIEGGSFWDWLDFPEA